MSGSPAFALVWPGGTWRLTTPEGHRWGFAPVPGETNAAANAYMVFHDLTGSEDTLECWPMVGEVPRA